MHRNWDEKLKPKVYTKTNELFVMNNYFPFQWQHFREKNILKVTDTK